MRQGVGTFVTASRPDAFMRSVSSMIILDRTSTEELIEAKNLIEPPVAAIAAKNADSSDIESLRIIVENMEKEFSETDLSRTIRERILVSITLLLRVPKTAYCLEWLSRLEGFFQMHFIRSTLSLAN